MHELRQVVQGVLNPKNIRCTAVRLSYCGEKQQQMQIAIDFAGGERNTSGTITSEPLPIGNSPVVEAIKLAETI